MFLRKPSSSGVSWAEETCSRHVQDVILKNQTTKVALPPPAVAQNPDSVVLCKSYFFFTSLVDCSTLKRDTEGVQFGFHI